MTTDFSKYQKIITNFRGKVGKSGFDAKFAASTSVTSKTEKFLLKMELKRLATACTRSIDLRGLVDGECKFFEYDGQSHFLDDIAINVFEEYVSAYGRYTFGVYEAVKNTENNFRVIYKNEQASIGTSTGEQTQKINEKNQYPATLYQFNQYNNRCEERMNFATTVVISSEDTPAITAMSSDISVNGCKLRLTDERDMNIGQIVSLTFTGLAEEFQFKKTDIYSYQIRSVKKDGNTQLIGCQRIETQEQDSFKRFLSGYIQGNKRRYRINLDNTMAALKSRSIEQAILPQINELPVYLEKTEKGYLPRYAITTNNNQAIYQYWQDENLNSTLPFLLNKKRLLRLKKQQDNNKSLLVYSFIHQFQGKSIFYTLDEVQLFENKMFLASFLTFASNQTSFSITELSAIEVDKTKAYSAFTIANSLPSTSQFINLPPSDDVNACLDVLSQLIVIKDLTHPDLVAEYQQLSTDELNTSALKQFGHKRLKSVRIIDELGISYKNRRQELRFIYNTPVVVECEKLKWQGGTHDFSISGLKIELDNPAALSMGDLVYLTFPKLQKITASFDLKELPYAVVRINKKKTIINLRVHVKEHRHIGRAFFKLLIEKNRNKLTPDEYAMLIPGLSEALRTFYAASMTTPSLVIQTSGSRYKIEVLVGNDVNNEFFTLMKRISDRPRFYNLHPLTSKLQVDGFIEKSLKKLLVSDEPLTEFLYISVDYSEEQLEKSVIVELGSKLGNPALKRFLIKKALKRGQFYCFELKISRTNEPDMEFLNAELSYISSYAIHRGKQLEQEIWSTVGVIQCFDITKEILFNYELFEGK